ncbi:YhfC family glutamic-type intramembrane protease [Chloroflexota bacterium]
MLEESVKFFVSWFVYPGLTWPLLLAGIGLAILFGAFWLVFYWPPLFKKHWLWAVLAGSAALSLAAVSFVQIPLQVLVGQALGSFWGQDVIYDWLLLASIPQILLSGLVQEGAKMVPMVVWWWRRGKDITPRLGLAIGAIAGAGLGIFEAVWAHGRIFASGWTLQALQTDGFLAVAGFWERFFAVGFHIAASALVGYGLAKGKGWQFYLIAALLHAALNYSIVLLQKGFFTIVHLETYAAVLAVLVAAAALLLRWHRTDDETAVEIE